MSKYSVPFTKADAVANLMHDYSHTRKMSMKSFRDWRCWMNKLDLSLSEQRELMDWANWSEEFIKKIPKGKVHISLDKQGKVL